MKKASVLRLLSLLLALLCMGALPLRLSACEENGITFGEIEGYTASEEITECISASGSAISLSEQSGGLSIEETIGRDFVPETDEKIALKQAIDCLDDEEKKLIMLRYYGNLSQKETGLRLGMTQVTVSRREAVILRKMAKLLGG